MQSVAASDDLAELAGLPDADYREAFGFRASVLRRPEEWARLILEDVPRAERFKMLAAWIMLGVRLALPGSPGQIVGWRIVRQDASKVVLEARALVGLTARVVVHVDGYAVTHAMLVRYDRAPGRWVWIRFASGHRRFLVALLQRASARAA